MKLILLISLALSLTIGTPAQTPIGKGDWVVPKFETEIAPFKFKAFVGMESSISVTQISPGVIAINDDTQWRDRGFPKLRDYVIASISQSKKKPSVVTLRNDAVSVTESGIRKQIKLLISQELELHKTLSELFFKGKRPEFLKSEYFSNLQTQIVSKIFTGSLSKIPIDQQKLLHIWADLDNNAFRESTFKEKKYFSVTTVDDVVYNTIQLNQAERTARQTEKSLKNLRELFSITGAVDGFDGLKLETTISSYDFVRKDEQKTEKYEFYVTYEELKKFIDADTTNQDLIDNSTILMDGSRMKVNVTSFS